MRNAKHPGNSPLCAAHEIEYIAAPFQKLFEQRGDFVACHAAEKWCEENGISVGRMQGSSARGLLFGDFDIQKWRNLSDRERLALDGEMMGDMRNGPVTVRLYRAPS